MQQQARVELLRTWSEHGSTVELRDVATAMLSRLGEAMEHYEAGELIWPVASRGSYGASADEQAEANRLCVVERIGA